MSSVTDPLDPPRSTFTPAPAPLDAALPITPWRPSPAVAVFVDAENLTQWLKGDGPLDLMAELAGYGSVVVRRAYGKWASGLTSFQDGLNRHGF